MNDWLTRLDDEGYAVLPGFLAPDAVAALRALTDRLSPPADFERGPWLQVHRHPIDDPWMARLASPALAEVGRKILHAERVEDLRLLEQVLIRTDPKPAPHGPTGWHVDWAFAPGERDARPRQTYFHLVHALSAVEPGGGAFTIVPGSHRRTYAAVAGGATLAALKADPVGVAGVDTAGAVEVCCNAGDLLVFDPMALHSASTNRRSAPRYVAFASFFDRSARRLEETLRATGYQKGYPAGMRDALPESLRGLLDWV